MTSNVPITDAADLVKRTPSPFEGIRQYVATGDLIGSKIASSTDVTYDDRPSRADNTVRSGDVLFAKMAGTKKTLVADKSHEEMLFSTGFAVLVPKEGLLDSRYLYHYLNSDDFNSEKDRLSSGATQKAINNKALKRISLPLPPLEEQKRIAAILDKADEIKTTSIQIQDSRIRIIQSAFVEMFGDPVVNPHNHRTILFGELGTLDRGKSKHRPRNDPMLLGGNHPLIQTGEIRSADLFVDTFTSTYSDFGLAQSRKWPAGTLAITIAANIAESAILGIEACFPDSIVGFTPNSNTNSVFIKAQLDFLKDRISEVAPQSAQKNINLKILREIPMICPPVEMQEQFEDFVRNATQIFDSVNRGIDIAEQLVHSSVKSLIN